MDAYTSPTLAPKGESPLVQFLMSTLSSTVLFIKFDLIVLTNYLLYIFMYSMNNKGRTVMTTTYLCECGKEFTTPNSFNGHKSHCKVHLEFCGKLETRKKQYKDSAQKVKET